MLCRAQNLTASTSSDMGIPISATPSLQRYLDARRAQETAAYIQSYQRQREILAERCAGKGIGGAVGLIGAERPEDFQ